jgi:hypothetical protein
MPPATRGVHCVVNTVSQVLQNTLQGHLRVLQNISPASSHPLALSQELLENTGDSSRAFEAAASGAEFVEFDRNDQVNYRDWGMDAASTEA